MECRNKGIEEDDELLPSCVEDVRASIDVDGDGDIRSQSLDYFNVSDFLIHEQAEYRQQSTLNFDVNKILFQPRGVRKERVEEQVHRQTSKIREMIVKNFAK